MIQLNKALNAWATPEFETVLKQELAQQAKQLPLEQALSASSSVAETPITVVIRPMSQPITPANMCRS